MTKCYDKYTVCKYVENKSCGNLLNELLWEGFNPEYIPFDELSERFVVSSIFDFICTGKSCLNHQKIIARIFMIRTGVF